MRGVLVAGLLPLLVAPAVAEEGARLAARLAAGDTLLYAHLARPAAVGEALGARLTAILPVAWELDEARVRQLGRSVGRAEAAFFGSDPLAGRTRLLVSLSLNDQVPLRQILAELVAAKRLPEPLSQAGTTVYTVPLDRRWTLNLAPVAGRWLLSPDRATLLAGIQALQGPPPDRPVAEVPAFQELIAQHPDADLIAYLDAPRFLKSFRQALNRPDRQSLDDLRATVPLDQLQTATLAVTGAQSRFRLSLNTPPEPDLEEVLARVGADWQAQDQAEGALTLTSERPFFQQLDHWLGKPKNQE